MLKELIVINNNIDMQAFYKITQKIKDILLADVNVHTVLFGVDNYRDLYKKAIYPVAHINPISSNFNSSQQNVVTLEISVLDQRDLSKNSPLESKWLSNDNQIDTLNTALAVLNRLCATLRWTHNDGIELLSVSEAVPVIFRELDLVDGWIINITLAIPNTVDVCIDDAIVPCNSNFMYTVDLYSCDCVVSGGANIINTEQLEIGGYYYDPVTEGKIKVLSLDGCSGVANSNIPALGGQPICADVICPIPAEPFITFTSSDFAGMLTTLGITDANDVAQWNTQLDDYWGPGVGAAFTSVVITGSTVTLHGGMDSLTILFLENLNLTAFDTNAGLPNLTYFDISFNQIPAFNPSAPLTSSTIDTLVMADNNISVFNPTYALPEGLNELGLSQNNIVTFNPTIPLPSTLTKLNLNSNQIVTFNPTIPLPNSVIHLNLQNNNIVTFNPDVLPTSLQLLILNENDIVTFNPTIPLPATLQSINLSNNPIVTFDPTIALPTSLISLILDNTLITNFNPTLGLPNLEAISINNTGLSNINVNLLQSNLNSINLVGNALSTALVDAILAKAVSLGLSTDNIVRLQGGTNGVPSATGLADKATLISNGVDVITN